MHATGSCLLAAHESWQPPPTSPHPRSQVRSLRKLHHPCIVQLKEVIRENDELFFVFEYMVRSLGGWRGALHGFAPWCRFAPCIACWTPTTSTLVPCAQPCVQPFAPQQHATCSIKCKF